MTFLKKLGTYLAQAVALVTGLYPLVQPFLGSGKASQSIGTAVNDFTLLAQQVITIETAMQGKSGVDKLTAVIPLINNVIMTSQVVTGKKVANQTLFSTAVQEYAQATVDLLNSLHEDSVQKV